MSIQKLGEVIGKGLRDSEAQKTEFIKPSTINSRFLFKAYKIQIKNTRFKIESRTIGDAFNLGHPNNAVLGTSKLGTGTRGVWTSEEEIGLFQNLTNAGNIEFGRWLNSNPAASSPESGNPALEIVLGTDDTAYTTDDTNLGTEIFRDTATLTKADKKLTYQIQMNSTTGFAIGTTINEFGLVEEGRVVHIVDTSTGGAEVNLTLGTRESITVHREHAGPGDGVPFIPYMIYGKAYESDGSTIIASGKIYLYNMNTEKMVETTTNSSGEYVQDLANLTSGYLNGDTIVIRSTKLFARYILNGLTTVTTKDYRFTLDSEFFDFTSGDSMITDDGLNLFRDWFSGNSVAAPTTTGWGTGATAPSRSDTSLEGEQERNIFITQNRVRQVFICEAILTTSEMNGKTIRKTGLFNSSTEIEGTSSTVDTTQQGENISFTIN